MFLKRETGVWKLQSHKAQAFRLGYIFAAVQSYVDAVNDGILPGIVKEKLALQTGRVLQTARKIGIYLNADTNKLIRKLPYKISGKPIPLQSAFKVGNIMGRVYFYSIYFKVQGSVPLREKNIEQLSETEAALLHAELPADFLDPVKALWEENLSAAGKGKFHSIDSEMEYLLDQLCELIENNNY
jgi:hypothetical protein